MAHGTYTAEFIYNLAQSSEREDEKQTCETKGKMIDRQMEGKNDDDDE